MEILKKFQQNYKSIIEIYSDYHDTYEGIKQLITDNRSIDLDEYSYELIERETTTGYKMKYHRDNYMLRKINNTYLFIPFSESKLPIYTLIWYCNSDFKGASLEFLSNKIYKPTKNMFIFFDSNDIHRVNEQLSGVRKIKIYKYYKK
jgi:hypothetical protein